MKKIAVYGKGSIGRSTTVSSVSATITAMGLTVMQIGRDPEADSTCNLAGGRSIPTALNTLRERGNAVLEDIMAKSPSDVFYVEFGGPIPGVGYVGWGIITVFKKPGELDACKICRPDVVLYSVLGDTVCGGLAMPIRGSCADEACIVTPSGTMPLYAISNVAHVAKSFREHGYTTLRGLILNTKNIGGGSKLADKAAEEIETPILYRLFHRLPI